MNHMQLSEAQRSNPARSLHVILLNVLLLATTINVYLVSGIGHDILGHELGEHCTEVNSEQSSSVPMPVCPNDVSHTTHERLRLRVAHVVTPLSSGRRDDVAVELNRLLLRTMITACDTASTSSTAATTVSVEHTGYQTLTVVAPVGATVVSVQHLSCIASRTCRITICKPMHLPQAARRGMPTSTDGMKLSPHECVGVTSAPGLAASALSVMQSVLTTLPSTFEVHREGSAGWLLCCSPRDANMSCALPISGMDTLSLHPAVSHIEVLARPRIQMKYSRGLVQGGEEFQEPLGELLGLTGAGYVIGVSDTGIDTDHCFFFDHMTDVPYDTYNPKHRKLVRYQAYGMLDAHSRGDFNPGHGTHVAGTLVGSLAAGSTANDTTIGAFHGAAPGAKLSFMDMSGSQEGEGIIARALDGLITMAAGDGATVMSNSWGGDLAEYTVSCASMDRYIHDTKRTLTVFFAAGNAADHLCNTEPMKPLCDRFTVMAPSTAKNAISVGSSEASMGSWQHADLANYLFTTDGGSPLSFFLLKGTGGPAFPMSIASKRIVLADPPNLCTDLSGGATYKDAIVLAYRGICTFESKTQQAIKVGAAALVVINDITGHGTVMGCPTDACLLYPLNSFMISQDDGAALLARMRQHSTTEGSLLGSITFTSQPMPDRGTDTLSSFSSHGPTRDLRYKPDVVSVGEMLHSAKSDANLLTQNCDFWASQGTSMATPLLAGHAVLVQEYLALRHTPAVLAPSAALMKALFVQAAKPLGGRFERNYHGDWRVMGDTPNFEEGHGFPVLSTILPINSTSLNNTTPIAQLFLLDEVAMLSGEAPHRYRVSYDGKQAAFQATLSWIDPAGSPYIGSARAMLVNNLDLRVVYNSDGSDVAAGTSQEGLSMRRGNAKLDVGLSQRAASSADVLNNVEKVRIAGARAGTFVVEVLGTHIATSVQLYSLVVSGVRLEPLDTASIPACPVSYDLAGAAVVSCGGRGTCSNGVCHCDNGWEGAACSTPIPTLSVGDTVSVLVEPMAWSTFRLETPRDIPLQASYITTTVQWINHSPLSDVDLAVCEGRLPTMDLVTDPNPAPAECVAVDRLQDNGGNIDPATPSAIVRSVTFQADAGRTYYLGLVGMCCYASNVTLTVITGLTVASAATFGAVPQVLTLLTNATVDAPQRVVMAARRFEQQLNVSDVALQLRHPRTFAVIVNGTCNSSLEVPGSVGGVSKWVCSVAYLASPDMAQAFSDAVVLLVNFRKLTVVSTPHVSQYRVRFTQGDVPPTPPTEQPVSAPPGSDSSSDSSSSSGAGSQHHEGTHNYTHQFRFRGKMGNCVPLESSPASCKTRNTAVLPSTATGVSFYNEDPPILPELALSLDAPNITTDSPWWNGDEDPEVILDLLDPITMDVLHGVDAWRINLECAALKDSLTIVCSNITGLFSGRAYRVWSKNVVHPYTVRAGLVVWVSPTPTISALSLEPYTHFSSPLTVSYPVLNAHHVNLYLQGTFLLPEVPSNLEGEDEHSDDVREYIRLNELSITFSSLSGMLDDITCAASTILTSGLLQCTVDEFPVVPEGSTFAVQVRSPRWYASVMGYVVLQLAPRPQILGIVTPSTGTVGVEAPLGSDSSITLVGSNFPSVPVDIISGARLGSTVPRAATLALLCTVTLDQVSSALTIIFQNASCLVASLPPHLVAPANLVQWTSGLSYRIRATFDVADDKVLRITTPTTAPADLVQVEGLMLATQAFLNSPNTVRASMLGTSPALNITQKGEYLWIALRDLTPITVLQALDVTLTTLAPPLAGSSTLVLESRCIVKRQLCAAGRLVCRVSPYVLLNTTYTLVVRRAGALSSYPIDANVSFWDNVTLFQGSTAPALPVARMSIEGVPLSVGATSYFVMDNAGPSASLVFVAAPSDCDDPSQPVGEVLTTLVPLSGSLVFAATPQLAAPLVHPCYSNGTLPATLFPDPQSNSGQPTDAGDNFYVPLDPSLWVAHSIAQVLSVTLLPTDDSSAEAVQVGIYSGAQVLTLQRTTLTAPMNITVELSEVAVQLSAGLDEEDPAYFLYLGAEVVPLGEEAYDTHATARWFPCNASRVHIFGQADSISADLRLHTFQDVRIVGDIIPAAAAAAVLNTSKRVRLCVEFSTSQSTAAMMPKSHFGSILTVVNSCGVPCDAAGGTCRTLPNGSDVCICGPLFTGSTCNILCPSGVLLNGTRAACTSAGTCRSNVGRRTAVCVCVDGRSGPACEVELSSPQHINLPQPPPAAHLPSELEWVGPLVLGGGGTTPTTAELSPPTGIAFGLMVVLDPSIALTTPSTLCKRHNVEVSLRSRFSAESNVIGIVPLASDLLHAWVLIPSNNNASIHLELVGAAFLLGSPSSRCAVNVALAPRNVGDSLPWSQHLDVNATPNTTTNTIVHSCGTSDASCRVVYGVVIAIGGLLSLLCFVMVVRIRHRVSLLEWR